MCNLMLASLALAVSLTTAGFAQQSRAGTKNKNLKYNPDGPLTIYVKADAPPEGQRTNWLPAPKAAKFSLHIRAYCRRRPR
jgi:hypothetical protein